MNYPLNWSRQTKVEALQRRFGKDAKPPGGSRQTQLRLDNTNLEE